MRCGNWTVLDGESSFKFLGTVAGCAGSSVPVVLQEVSRFAGGHVGRIKFCAMGPAFLLFVFYDVQRQKRTLAWSAVGLIFQKT